MVKAGKTRERERERESELPHTVTITNGHEHVLFLSIYLVSLTMVSPDCQPASQPY